MESNAYDKLELAKEAPKPTVFSTGIDASFQADATVREALTANLKPLHANSEAINARLEKAFEKFNPADLTTGERSECLVGTRPLLEDFKLIHRALDVKKVQAEVRHAEFENIR